MLNIFMENLEACPVILYHGSNMVADRPEIRKPSRPLDFGEGFYTTFSREQACRWSSKVFERRNDGSPILNIYEYDRFEAAEKLKIRTFEKPDAEWLRFVISNRTSDFFHDFDIVEGPVANDTMYSVLIGFENGIFSLDETISRLKPESLTDQVLFHTPASLGYLKFTGFEEVSP